MADKLTKKDLKDGTMLRELIKMFQTSHTQVSLAGLLTCLRDSEVVVPVKFKEEEGATTTLPDGRKEHTFTPCTAIGDDKGRYLLVFSSLDQVDEKLKADYKMAEMEFMQCMIMAEKMREVKGIIIDAYTKQFVLKNDLFGYVRNIPSKISK